MKKSSYEKWIFIADGDLKEEDDEFEYLYEIKANKLTRYAVEVRYPDEFYIPSIEEAKEAVEIAKKVKSFIRRKLP